LRIDDVQAFARRLPLPRIRTAVVLAALLLTPTLYFAQERPSPSGGAAADWPNYNRDLMGTRHSPLRQITPANVGRLKPAWTLKLGRGQDYGALTGGSELTPLVVDGVMYVLTSRSVVALESDSGKERWRWDVPGGVPSKRGLGYWPGDGTAPARIVFTSVRRMIALDAATGKPIEGFGANGIVDIERAYNGSTTIYKNLAIVGTNVPPGAVRAFDVRTGRKVWEFRSVSDEPGAPGQDTWENDSWKTATGALGWAFSVTVDPRRNTLYAVFDSPTNDYYGGERKGQNLYANSIVALDADTGTYKWHFQTTHHDLWDYDPPSAPGLLDVRIDGRDVPILAQAGKTGYMYILNRETGRPVFGIEERPVPRSEVPGEASWPTQPIPVKPAPIARVSYKPEDIVTAADTTAEHADFCRALEERSGGFINLGPFTPYVYRAPGGTSKSTVLFPGSVGGANWGGVASDPGLGYVFVNTMDEASIGWIEPRPGRGGGASTLNRNSVVGTTSRFQWSEGKPGGGGNLVGSGEKAWPCQKPPWGNLVAVDAKTGEIAWRVPLGITEQLPEAKQRTGRLNMGGPITTASGLLFIGASNDRRFRAFDSKTGRELWVTPLKMSAHAVPITYQAKNGKQFVAIVAAGASALDDPAPDGAEELIAFALP
jgi:quinoprotein glucose dehydrogenase